MSADNDTATKKHGDGDLSDEQQAAYDEIEARLADGARFTSLLGYAGTGKTFLAGRLAHALAQAGRSVTCCAPTHKAAQVLRQKIEGGHRKAARGDVPVSTLHALLGLRLVPDGQGGYHLAGEPYGADDLFADVVIVDEASMIGAEEWAHVEQTAPHVQWLFVGDPAQLPPVGEGTSPALAQPGTALEAARRQRADSPILRLATAVRTGAALAAGAAQLPEPFDGAVGVATTRRRGAFVESAARAFAAEAFREDPARARLLVYRNRTASGYNQAIRAAVQGGDAPRFQKGEWLVARETWLFDGDTQLLNSEEVRVETAREGTAESADRQTWRVWRLVVRGAGAAGPARGRRRAVEVLHEDEAARYHEELARRKEAALKEPERWQAFYALKERFATVDYAYAMTVHRAQGSTFDTAFVDARDLAACRDADERQALAYVAASRPARRLALLV